MTRPPFSETARSLLRVTVFAALDELLVDRPWSGVTMTHVARSAGVSRQTLYNEFGNRDDLAAAYALWAADQFLDEVERAIAERRDSLHDALDAAFALFLDIAAGHPLVRALGAATGAEGLHALLASAAGVPVLRAAADRLSSIVSANWPVLPAGDVTVISEVIVRLAVSYLTVPTGSPQEAASQVSLALGPYLDHVATTAGIHV